MKPGQAGVGNRKSLTFDHYMGIIRGKEGEVKEGLGAPGGASQIF